MAIKPVQLRSPSSGGGDWELAASRYMMGAHVCQCVGDRIWGLFLPLYLAELSPDSVAPVAVIEVARHLAGMLFSTSVADACERRGARTVLWLLLLCENAGVLLGAFCSTAAGGAFLGRLRNRERRGHAWASQKIGPGDAFTSEGCLCVRLRFDFLLYAFQWSISLHAPKSASDPATRQMGSRFGGSARERIGG